MKTKPNKTWYKDPDFELVQSFTAAGWLEKAKSLAWYSREDKKIGAVLIHAQDEQKHATVLPLGQGWNYVPSALKHITEERSKYAVHAEMKAMEGVQMNVLDEAYIMYVWGLPPCGNCLKHMLGQRVKKVVFYVMYDSPKWKNNTMDFIKAMHSK